MVLATVIDCPLTFVRHLVQAFRLIVFGTRTMLHNLLKNQQASVTGNFAIVAFAVARRAKCIAASDETTTELRY
jgi:hypothetical protein